LRPLVSAELARGVRAEIPLFFYAAEIAAAGMRQGEQLVPELRGAASKRKVHQLSRREHGHALGSAGFHRGSEIL